MKGGQRGAVGRGSSDAVRRGAGDQGDPAADGASSGDNPQGVALADAAELLNAARTVAETREYLDDADELLHAADCARVLQRQDREVPEPPRANRSLGGRPRSIRRARPSRGQYCAHRPRGVALSLSLPVGAGGRGPGSPAALLRPGSTSRLPAVIGRRKRRFRTPLVMSDPRATTSTVNSTDLPWERYSLTP